MNWNNISGRCLLFITCILLSCGLMAQSDSLSAFSKGTHHIYLYTSFDLGSPTLTNEFVGKFYRGNYLSETLRQKTSARLNDNNIGGYSLEGGLYYFFAPKNFKSKFGYYIGIEEHELAELDFRKNFFDLVFFGNEPYTNEFVKFDNMKLNIMAWQQFKVGIFKASHKNRKVHQFGGAFAFNIGQKNLSIDMHKGSLFTQKNGEFVALDVDMDVHRTDTNHSSFGAFNGYGVSFDLSYNYTDLNRNEFQIRMSDFGYIRWDHTPEFFNRDTTFRFDGFDVDIFDINSTVFNSNTGDSIVNELIGSDREMSYSTWLPLDIQLIYTHHFKGRKFSITAEAKHKIFSVYRPFFSLKPGYKIFLKKSYIGFYPIVTYGGYGGLNVGLNISSQINRNLYIEIGTSTISSFIMPSKAVGLSGMLTVYKTL